MRPRVIPPPLLFAMCVAAGVVAQRRWPLPRVPLYPFQVGLATGIVLMIAAAILGASAILTMTRAQTPLEPGHDPHRLVTSGPFRISRNPIYVSLVTLTVAVAAMLCSLWLIIGAALLVVLLDRLVIAGEERAITRVFGEEYRAYCTRVRRWL